jgi:methyl-accepting chemotaxis protein
MNPISPRASERVCYDPYARRFVPGWFYHMMRFFISSGYAERRGKGVIGFLVARERYIDDYLAGCLYPGIDQLVKSVESIAAVTEEAASGTEEVSASTEEQTASVQEIAASAESLSEMAQELQKAVSVFKL